MKGALEVERPSLKRLRGEDLERGLLYWEPWKVCKERLQIGASLSIGAPFKAEVNLEPGGGSYTGEFEG